VMPEDVAKHGTTSGDIKRRSTFTAGPKVFLPDPCGEEMSVPVKVTS